MSDNPTEDQPTLKKVIPIPFYTAIGANGALGLSTDRITFPYRVKKVQAHFRDDAAKNLQAWVFVSRNNNVGTAPPPDNKVLGFYSPTPYLVGEGEIISVECDVLPDPEEQFVKVFFVNLNAYAQTGYVIVTIETVAGQYPGQSNVTVNAGDEARYTLDEWATIMSRKGQAMQDQVLDGLTGTPEWLKNVDLINRKGNGVVYDDWNSMSAYLATMVNFYTPDMHNDEFVPALQQWFGIANQLMSYYSTAETIGNVLSLGQLDFVKTLTQRDEAMWGITREMGKINEITFDASMNKYAKYSADWYFQANIPAVDQLINMVVKEKIELDVFKEQMRKQGFSAYWSQLIWDAHFIAPDFETAKRAYWRGGITQEELPDFLKLVDLDPKFNEQVWLRLTEEVPQYQDLINMRVKEVISQETFQLGLQYQGYYGDWAQRLWDAHFTPASFTDFLTAMRRQKTVSVPVAEGAPISHTFGVDAGRDIEIIKQLSILADYDPRYWDFFETRMYNDPSYRMIMWGYESGAIPLERVPDLVHRLGLNPIDESWYQQFITTFQERPWITRYLTALQTAYINNAITEEDLRNRVRAIPRNENIASWMVRIANVRKEIQASGTVQEQQKLITDAELKQGYVLGLLTEDDFRTRLLAKGYNLIDVDLMIEIINKQNEIADVGGKKEGLTVAEYFDAWRYGEITQDMLTTALLVKGLNLDQINILIETKKKKWGVGGVETQLS